MQYYDITFRPTQYIYNTFLGLSFTICKIKMAFLFAFWFLSLFFVAAHSYHNCCTQNKFAKEVSEMTEVYVFLLVQHINVNS